MEAPASPLNRWGSDLVLSVLGGVTLTGILDIFCAPLNHVSWPAWIEHEKSILVFRWVLHRSDPATTPRGSMSVNKIALFSLPVSEDSGISGSFACRVLASMASVGARVAFGRTRLDREMY